MLKTIWVIAAIGALGFPVGDALALRTQTHPYRELGALLGSWALMVGPFGVLAYVALRNHARASALGVILGAVVLMTLASLIYLEEAIRFPWIGGPGQGTFELIVRAFHIVIALAALGICGLLYASAAPS